jgi:EmrB/QacA subfamily drug resistance transporter
MHVEKNTRILILLFIGVLMGALDISIVGPAIPSIEKTIQMADRDVSWIFSIYVLCNLVGISLMARLSDYFGRRWIYIISIAVFGAGSLVVAFSHEMTPLLIGRAIQGFGSSGIFPVASAVIGDVFPVEKRGRALGLIGAVFGIAFIMGPFIAGFMLMYFDWNALFLINIPIAILLMAFSFFLLPGRTLKEKPQMDWDGMIILAVILTSFTLGVNNIQTDNIIESLGSWSVLPFLMLVLLLSPVLFMLEVRQHDPVVNIRLFSSTQIRLVGFITFGLGLFQSTIVFLPKLAVDIFGASPSKASFMLLPVVLMTAIGSPVTGRLTDKIGSRIIIITGLFITAAGLFLLSLLTRNVMLFYLSEGLLGFGLSMRASLNYIMLNEVSARERASTQGILIIFISIGQLTGAAFTGALSSTTPGKPDGFGYAFIAMAALSVLLFLFSFFLKNRKRELEIKERN